MRVQVVFEEHEADALARLAAEQLRDPRDQIRLIVRQELERLRLLPTESFRGIPNAAA